MSDVNPATDTVDASPSDDIRLLGRLLGDAIRATEGDETFELVEQIRRLAVDGRRTGTNNVAAMRDILGRQPMAEQLLVVRALDWLSLLANAAEDSYV
jgi:phosphoenolpyruvate carboxylase